jgi:hypothetical protein
MRFAMYSAISVCGVMGYPKKYRHPDAMAASAIASLPFINTLSDMSAPLYVFLHFDHAVGAHGGAHGARDASLLVRDPRGMVSFGIELMHVQLKDLLRAYGDAEAAALASLRVEGQSVHSLSLPSGSISE